MPIDSTSEYTRLRAELQMLQAANVPNQRDIDRVIDALEQLQLKIKGEHSNRKKSGLSGNNPIE